MVKPTADNPETGRSYRALVKRFLGRKGRSQAWLADALGRSQSWTSQMLNGGRPLKPAIAEDITRVLDLGERDRLELLARVEAEEGNSELARARAMAYMAALERDQDQGDLAEEYLYHLSEWHVGAVLELSRCDGYRPDPQWIAATLRPRIEPAQAAHALRVLVRLGLLDEECRARPRAPTVESPRDVSRGPLAEAAKTYHRRSLRLAAEAIEGHRPNERFIGGACLALSEASFANLRARIQELAALGLHIALDDPHPPTRVYQFCLALFPTSLYTDTEYDPSEV